MRGDLSAGICECEALLDPDGACPNGCSPKQAFGVSEVLESEAASNTTHTPNARSGDLLAGIHDGAWLDAYQPPPLRFAVPGLIAEGLTLLVGPPKAGKSYLALDMLLAAASGGTALGALPVGEPRRVLYLALEDSDRRMKDRCGELLLGQATPPLFSYVTRIHPGTLLATVTTWMERYPGTGLVVIDTLGRVMPLALPGESAYQRDYRAASALKELADAHEGLSVVVLHHDRKANTEDFVDAVSGTHGLAGAADTITVLAHKRGNPSALLKVTGRDVAEQEIALIQREGGKGYRLDGADLSKAAAKAAEQHDELTFAEKTLEVLQFIKAHPEGVRAKEAVAKFGESAYTYLSRLEKAGRIDKAGRGLYVLLPQRGN